MENSPNSLISLQFYINQILYEAILGCFEIAKEYEENETSSGILISAISTNLGVILAQLPHDHQERYLKISEEIIKKSFLATLETIATVDTGHGQVGHA